MSLSIVLNWLFVQFQNVPIKSTNKVDAMDSARGKINMTIIKTKENFVRHTNCLHRHFSQQEINIPRLSPLTLNRVGLHYVCPKQNHYFIIFAECEEESGGIILHIATESHIAWSILHTYEYPDAKKIFSFLFFSFLFFSLNAPATVPFVLRLKIFSSCILMCTCPNHQCSSVWLHIKSLTACNNSESAESQYTNVNCCSVPCVPSCMLPH